MKLRHNKKRNTAFLYEVLIKELTKNIVSNDHKKKNTILSILKEHYNKDSILYKELQLYKDILDSKELELDTAEKILHEAKRVYWGGLDKEEIFDEQSEVVSKINKNCSKSVYSNFIPNYKDLATIAQIFNDDLTVKKRVLLEKQVVKNMTLQVEEKETLKPISELAYKTFVKKFNSKYNNLLDEQQKLLNYYILSPAENNIQLKVYLNEELGRLKEIVGDSLELKEIKADEAMATSTEQVLNLMEGFKQKEIDDDMIKQVLKVQELAREIQE